MEEGHERRLEQRSSLQGNLDLNGSFHDKLNLTAIHQVDHKWSGGLKAQSMNLNGCNENCMFSVMHPTYFDRKGRCAMI